MFYFCLSIIFTFPFVNLIFWFKNMVNFLLLSVINPDVGNIIYPVQKYASSLFKQQQSQSTTEYFIDKYPRSGLYQSFISIS